MKFVFFVLFSLNVVFLIWEYYGSERSKSNSDEVIQVMQDSDIDSIILLEENSTDRVPAGAVAINGETGVPNQIYYYNRDDPQIVEAINQRLSKSITQNLDSLVLDLLEVASTRQIIRLNPGAGDDFEFTTDSSWQDKTNNSCCPAAKLRPELEFRSSSIPRETSSDEVVATDVEEIAETLGVPGSDDRQEANDRKNTDSIDIDSGVPESTVEFEKFCYKLGPRFSRKRFFQIAANLKQAGSTSDIKSETVDKETAFMVYYPAAESFQAAKANVKMLKSKGLRDLWLINKGEMRGSISLGIFNTRKRAEIMQQEMKAKKIDSRIKPKLSKRTGYFLLFGSALVIEELSDRLAGSGFEGKEMVSIDLASCEG